MTAEVVVITKYEYELLLRLRNEGHIKWAGTNRAQTAALNRLVKKQRAVPTESGWRKL